MANYRRNFLLEVLLWGFHSLPRSAYRSADFLSMRPAPSCLPGPRSCDFLLEMKIIMSLLHYFQWLLSSEQLRNHGCGVPASKLLTALNALR